MPLNEIYDEKPGAVHGLGLGAGGGRRGEKGPSISINATNLGGGRNGQVKRLGKLYSFRRFVAAMLVIAENGDKRGRADGRVISTRLDDRRGACHAPLLLKIPFA